MMKSKKTWISISILLFLFLLTITVKNDLVEFQKIFHHPFLLAAVFLFVFLTSMINALKIKLLLVPFNIRLPFGESFTLANLTTFGNYLTPFRGGAALRAYYLKKHYTFSYSLFLSTLSALYIVLFLATSLIGLGLLLFLYLTQQTASIVLLTFFISILLGTSACIIIRAPKSSRSHWLMKSLNKMLTGWDEIRRHKLILVLLLLLDVLLCLAIGLRFYFILLIFGIAPSFAVALLLALISALSSLITITPASLGIKEASVAYFSTLLKNSFSSGLLVSVVDRAIEMIYLLILGPVSMKKLFRGRKIFT